MNLFWWLTAINTLLLLMAHANTWLPVTFQAIDTLVLKYTYITDNIVFGYVAFRYTLRTRQIMPKEVMRSYIFGESVQSSVKASYRFNWLAFLFYQIILVIVL
jgi:hypothetical protein